MTVYGYARVSTPGQQLDIQIAQLQAMGCEQILFEKESGLDDDRAAMKRLLRRLKPGDVVVFPALDRLTRGGPFKMLRALDEITSRGASYKSLAEPFVDPTSGLEEIFAALVGWVARKTRDDIAQRTKAGRERARQNGVRFGRKPKLTESEQGRAIQRRQAGEPQRSIAQTFNVSCSTISRLRPR